VNFNKFLKFVKIRSAISGLRLHRRQWRFSKNSKATTKCDAERNWSTYDFTHIARSKRKLDNYVRAFSNLSSHYV